MPEIVTPLGAIPSIPECICIPQPMEKVCITFPVAGQICSTSGFDFRPPSEVLLGFLGNLQPLMAPLMPILRLLSVAIALIDCIKAIPDAIGSLSPGPVIDCIDHLVELIPGLLEFIPPFSYIALMRSIVFFLINLLQAIIEVLTEVLTLNVSVELEGLPDNDQFRCCLDANINSRLNQFSAALQPTGPLFQIVAQVLKILALPGTEDYIQPIIDAAEFLSGSTVSGISPDLLSALQDVQNVLVAVHSVLGSAVGAVQSIGDCDC